LFVQETTTKSIFLVIESVFNSIYFISFSHIDGAEIKMAQACTKTMILIRFLKRKAIRKPLVERALKKKYFKILVFGDSFL